MVRIRHSFSLSLSSLSIPGSVVWAVLTTRRPGLLETQHLFLTNKSHILYCCPFLKQLNHIKVRFLEKLITESTKEERHMLWPKKNPVWFENQPEEKLIWSSVWPPPFHSYSRAWVSGLILIELHSKLTNWVSRAKTVSSVYPPLRAGSCQPFWD